MDRNTAYRSKKYPFNTVGKLEVAVLKTRQFNISDASFKVLCCCNETSIENLASDIYEQSVVHSLAAIFLQTLSESLNKFTINKLILFNCS